MKLVLLRHAEAVDRAPTDTERALTDKGRLQATAVGEFYRRLDCEFTHIFSSPYLRTRQTAELALEAFGGGLEIAQDKRFGCGMKPEDAARILRSFSEEAVVLLVGHQPDLGVLAGYLTGARGGANYEFRKACSALFDITRFVPGGGVLEMFVPMRAICSYADD